MFQYLSP